MIDACTHDEVELRRMDTASGGIQMKYQCLACGAATTNPISHAKLNQPIEAYGAWDHELRRSFNARVESAMDQAARDRRFEWLKRHDAVMASPEWKLRRQKVFARCNSICEGCGDRPASEVHHLSYEHLGNEPLWELVAVCWKCHASVHPHMQIAIPGDA